MDNNIMCIYKYTNTGTLHTHYMWEWLAMGWMA